MTILLILITCLLDSVVKIVKRIYILITPGSERVKDDFRSHQKGKSIVHSSIPCFLDYKPPAFNSNLAL